MCRRQGGLVLSSRSILGLRRRGDTGSPFSLMVSVSELRLGRDENGKRIVRSISEIECDWLCVMHT